MSRPVVYVLTPSGVTRYQTWFATPRAIATVETSRGNHAVTAEGRYLAGIPLNPCGWFRGKLQITLDGAQTKK